MLRSEKYPPETDSLAPRIHIAARQAAELYPQLGEKGVSALALLGEVSDGQSSLWVNRRQRVSLKRAMLIEINSNHRIRAEDLLSESEALALAKIRLATPPSQKYLRDWAKLSTDKPSRLLWVDLYKNEAIMHQIPLRPQSAQKPKQIKRTLLSGLIKKRELAQKTRLRKVRSQHHNGKL